MSETTVELSGREEDTPSSSKCQRGLYSSMVVFSFLGISASAIILVVIFVLFIEDCAGCRSFLAQNLGTAAAVLFIVGLLILLTIVCYKRRQNNLTSQVVISSIPAEDWEKSAAPILPYISQVPHRQPFVIMPWYDLPDYSTAIQNKDDVLRDSVPDSLPPTYEEALEVALSTSQAR